MPVFQSKWTATEITLPFPGCGERQGERSREQEQRKPPRHHAALFPRVAAGDHGQPIRTGTSPTRLELALCAEQILSTDGQLDGSRLAGVWLAGVWLAPFLSQTSPSSLGGSQVQGLFSRLLRDIAARDSPSNWVALKPSHQGAVNPHVPFRIRRDHGGSLSRRAGPYLALKEIVRFHYIVEGTPNAFFTSPTIAGSCTLLLLTDTRTPLCGISRPPPRPVSKNEDVDFGFALDGACPRYACAMEMVKAQLTIERDIEIFRRSREATSCNAGCSRPQVRHIGSGAHYPGATAK